MFFLGALLIAGTAAPYLLPRSSLAPMTGAALWLSVLALRAVLVGLAALIAILYLPATSIFQLMTHWCFHAVLPFLTTHLGFSGHGIGDAATLVPGLVLGISAISAIFAIWRTARAMRRWVKRSSLGPGPGESVIVGGHEVVVAAAGIRGAQIVISTGALTRLDEEELAASLAHERGHIARCHPYLVLAANLAFGIARCLPGSRDALRRFQFCLERDADEYAVDRTRNPIALASAICKAAADSPTPGPAFATLAGSGAPARLRLLLDRSAARPNPWAEAAARGLVVALVGAVLLAAAVTPTLARAGVTSMQATDTTHSCED
ncbi:MAG: M56 family metallopeptidase [Thermoleophilia bacterium]|nr:M56 family metallopeptidase [Thermoleophilia bacterium]